MASVDPYMPCPCGSGEKFKWCCQKVESYADRAQRMVDSGQIESSLKPLEEGLARFPDNAWLLTRKAVVEAHLKRTDAAKATLQRLLKKKPGHAGGTILLTRLLLETESPDAAIAQFQQGLSAMPPDRRPELAPLAQFLGVSLKQAGLPIAALKHLELAWQWAGDMDKDQSLSRSIVAQRADARTSAWEKNPYRLKPAPEGVADAFRGSFERALGWAEEGLWASAASAFELLSAGSSAGAIADHNRGLCCLWIADHQAAIAALRRYIARTGPTTDAVDLEALCQLLEGGERGETVEFIHLTWPIRDRAGLLRALEVSPYFERGPERPIDRDDPDSSPTDRFFLLDRRRIEARPGLSHRDIPMTEGEVIVGENSVVLETYDDNRLDRLIDRFTAAAGATIPPAHPRTKLIERVPRYLLALTWQWSLPRGLSDDDIDRLNREKRAQILSEVWPETPNPALGGRTPVQAARAGGAETALRAAIRLLETSEPAGDELDWGQVRARLGLPPEPAIDPRDLDLDRLHLSRWSMIPAAELDDDRLVELFRRAREWGLNDVVLAAARAIADRPALVASSGLDPLGLFGALALDAAGRGDRAAAEEWIRRGRQVESLKPAPRTLEWELTELQASTMLDGPETWVPTVVALLDRYRSNQDATAAVLYRLMRMGLVRPVVDPKRPDQVLLDMGLLDQLIAQYGPRITTAAGDLGAAAGRSAIWTPESARGGAAIWTPGSEAAPAPRAGQEQSRLILPGQ
jgi:tetratricopeptide (TPR) repeat protein